MMIMEGSRWNLLVCFNLFYYSAICNDRPKQTPISKAKTVIPIYYSCEKTNALTSILSRGFAVSGVFGSVKAV